MPARRTYYRRKAPVAAPRRVYRRKAASIPSVRGRGAYSIGNGNLYPRTQYTYQKPGPWGKLGAALGRAAGGAAFGPLGAAAGGKIGSYAHYIGKIFGSGDYVTASAGVKSNNLINSSAQAPQFTGSNTVRIRHREYLGDIITSSVAGAFSIQQFPINPGVAASFPWLSQVCGSTFQQYRLNGLVFEFRSMSGDALTSTNTALGSVIMATDYDSKDSAFTTKQQMENTMFGVSCKPSSCMIHAIECARNQTSVSELYVRAFAVPTGADVRLYDMGNFYIATQGMQGASVNIGELWMSYDITFLKEIEQVPGFLMPLANYSPVSASGTAPLGTSIAISSLGVDSIGLTFTENRILFPVTTVVGSVFQWTYTITTASSALTLPAVTYNNGFTDLATYKAPNAGATVTNGVISGLCRLTTAGTPAALPYINLADYTTGAISYCQLNVYQVSGVPQVP